MEEELDGVDSYEKNKEVKKRKFKETYEKITDCLDPRKTKMVVEFNDKESASIKSLAVRMRNEIKVTTRFKHSYIPHRDLWINRLYFEISNSTQKQCLTIDTRDINGLEPAKFRRQADNETEQISYYNRNKKDTSFNSFLALRKETSSASKIKCPIVKVIDKTNRHNTIYSEISDGLSDFKNYIVQQIVQQTSENDLVRETTHK